MRRAAMPKRAHASAGGLFFMELGATTIFIKNKGNWRELNRG